MTIGYRDCTRCTVGAAASKSPYCASCLELVDRIIARAADAPDDYLGWMLGLSTDAVGARRRRMRKGAV